MATLTIDIVFDSLSDEELGAVYDQTEAVKKAVEKAVKKLPLGRFLTGIHMY